MAMLSEQFTQIFRSEHRQVRDTLLDLIQTFQERNKTRIQSLLNQVATLTGPHFRYEEEALYPLLVEIFGEEYIEQLLCAHDQAIRTAKGLIELANKDPLTDGEITEVIRLIRMILPHVSDCDGLSIMVERLSEEKVRSILYARDRALQAGLNLLTWAKEVRVRPLS
jgi:hypothetical protein